MHRVGIVGCGFMGKMHAAVYDALPDVKIAAVADIREAPAAELASPRGALAFRTLPEMLEYGDCNVIDICLPTYLHPDHVVMAAQAGRHVLCEKPMALTLEDADRMIAAAREAGVHLMIAHCIRFWPEYETLKEITDSGRLGSILSVSLRRLSPRPGWAWDGWLADPSRSGGAALDLHIHDTDYILHLLGSPTSVHSRGVVTSYGPDHIQTVMTFGHAVASLEGGWGFPDTFPFRMAFHAVFERGSVQFDGGPLTVHEQGKPPETPTIAKLDAAQAGGNISDLGGYYREVRAFLRGIETGAPVARATPESSRQSLAVVLEEIAQVLATAH